VAATGSGVNTRDKDGSGSLNGDAATNMSTSAATRAASIACGASLGVSFVDVMVVSLCGSVGVGVAV